LHVDLVDLLSFTIYLLCMFLFIFFCSFFFFFFSSRRRHTRSKRDWSSDVCSSDLFLANYAYINLADPVLRSPGIGNVQVFGAGQYAMRLWVKPYALAKLSITVPQIVSAIQAQKIGRASCRERV